MVQVGPQVFINRLNVHEIRLEPGAISGRGITAVLPRCRLQVGHPVHGSSHPSIITHVSEVNPLIARDVIRSA